MLRLDSRDVAAQRGLTVAAGLVIEMELGRDPRVALALLEEWPSVDAQLATKVRAAAAEEAKERAAMSKLTRDHDQQIGRRTRIGVFVLGTAWSIASLVSDRVGPITALRFAVGAAIQIPLVGLAYIVLPQLRSNLFNRRMVSSILLTVSAQVALFLCGLQLGVPLLALRILAIGLWSVVAAALTLFVDRRFWPMAAALVVAFVVAALDPSLRPYAASFGTLMVAANLAFIWRQARSRAK